jgi:site-specific DNA recombinase
MESDSRSVWLLDPSAYDDGGYSGGSIDRPGLQRLLAEVTAGRIQVIVVYKVDHLTRSLADFALIIERLDAHEASFVSVTQQFNTTSSMGRLTLNVLLSFAQFEREVTGDAFETRSSRPSVRDYGLAERAPTVGTGLDNKPFYKFLAVL